MNLRALGNRYSIAALPALVIVLALSVFGVPAGDAAPSCGAVPAQPAHELVYRAQAGSEPVSAQARERTAELICDRLEAIGVDGAGVELLGANRVRVGLPELSPAKLERAAEVSGASGRAYFYDWEPNLVGRERAIGGHPGVQPPMGALNAAVREWRRAGRDTTTYTNAHLIQAGALPSRAAARRLARQTPAATTIVSEFPASEEGRVLRNGTPGWYALRDRPALTGDELIKIRLTYGQLGEPGVSFKFTEPGRAAFEQVTRQIAERGQAAVTGRVTNEGAAALSGHLAIVVDGVVLTRPIINFKENPQGIDGRTGAQISGGFSSTREAQALAAILRSGELPLNLKPVRPLP